MLNTDLVKSLFAGLDKAQQQELLELLFKKSKQNMNYFDRTKDISLSKLETLADYFHMPLDYFRQGNKFNSITFNGNNNYVANVSLSSNLLVENQSLMNQIELLRKIIKDKDDLIETQRDHIRLLMAFQQKPE